MDLNLRGRSFVVTGGTAGLGFATAECLVAEGASVLVSSRSQESVDSAVSQLGDSARGMAADNGDPAAADMLMDSATSAFGRIDGLMVSVGGPPRGSVESSTDEQWRDSFESVFLGTVRLMRAAAARMSEGGAIGVVLSSSMRTPISNLAISNGFRPGLGMVIKTFADELGPRGIRVLGFVPGRIRTARTTGLDHNDPADAKRRGNDSIPLRRMGEPEEFGKVAAFALSPAGSYLTGSAITIDGGMIRAL